MKPEEIKQEIKLLKNKINLMEEWIKEATSVIYYFQNHLFDLEDESFDNKFKCKNQSYIIK